MVEIIINGTPVQVEEGTTILKAARQIGVDIPTLCFFDGLCDVGACRICVVEIEGEDRLSAACNTVACNGMNITTNSERVMASRLNTLEMLLSQHDLDCPNCVRKGTCRLQALLLEFGLVTPTDDGPVETQTPYGKKLYRGRRAAWDATLPIQRDTNRCIKCGRCIAACKNLEGIGVWDYCGSGSDSYVGVRDGLTMNEAKCVSCGQCITHCPVGALRERDDIDLFLDAVRNPEITTVVNIAPATRTSFGVGLGAEDGSLNVERMVAALKKIGVDYVFDTSYTADLTIMEEGTELLHRLGTVEPDENGIKWPMFTSCCPAWVLHAKQQHHDAMANLSTAKSPMMMFGAVTKSWFAQRNNLDPAKVYSVAMMPCTAKKHEVNLPMQANEGVQDMDASLTTRELIRMISRCEIDINALEDVPLDNPLGEYTGAGVIFGTTGGVMEAALRSAYFFVVGELPPDPEAPFAFSPAEAGPWVEASFDLPGATVRCAVASGLADTDKLLDAIRAGVVEYDFVEIMACPSGCAGGGGQPIDGSDLEKGLDRGQTLRKIDRSVTPLRYSHENPVVQFLYEDFLGEPCGHLSHELLHTEHVPL